LNGSNQVWVLIACALIFFMQAGFLALEVGLVRSRSATVTAMKCIVDWSVVSIIWLVFAYGFAFGDSAGGWLGGSFFGGDGIEGSSGGWTMFLFQLCFAGTAVTIVSGAMAERVGFHTYVICSAVNVALIYPLVAHWVWGGAVSGDETWLYGMGFRDFAGSTVVHSVGGWISLVAIWMLGPRLGRFDADGKPRPMDAFNVPLAGFGVLVLWMGWFGFNGGSTLQGNDSAAAVIIKTNLAGAASGLVAWAHARWSTPDRDVEMKFMGGALTGLVAITASANMVSPMSALAIGAIAGLVHNYAFELLLKLRLDDPVGAVPVHLFGGVFGTLCVALFGKSSALPKGRFEQLGVQAIGVVAVAVTCVAITYGLLLVLKKTIGLRVSPREENEGLTLCRLPDVPAQPALSEAEIRRLMGG
jgi:ammonium transporter, Amt family